MVTIATVATYHQIWHFYAMRTTIDGAGRIVVPKALRTALGFEENQELEIRAIDGRLEVEPAPTPMRLVRRGKGLSAVSEREMPELTAETVRAALESVRR
jgi:AbrB family looped-hinge helix DNA binding protein